MKIKVYIGVIGAGKDYLSHKQCNTVVSFADGVREDIWKLIGWEPKTEEEYTIFKQLEFRGNDLGLKGHNISFTGRDLLQRYGTDIRRSEDIDYWVNRTIRFIELFRTHVSDPEFTIGIADCRFENEVKKLIEFSEQESIKLEFVHTNFKSDRYNDKSDHESEKFAQQFLNFTDNQEKFNKLIWKKYGI